MRRTGFVFVALSLLSSAALASGFRVTAHGARAMGMGLAYTAVSDDASAIYFNPAGLSFDEDGSLVLGAVVARNLEGEFVSPAGVTEEQQASDTLVPEIYWSHPFGRWSLGIGAYGSFGLPMRWENPATFSGRHVAYLSTIRTLNLNPSAAFKINDQLAFGAGVDWSHSKVQLESFRQASFPVAPGVTITRDVANAKLTSDIADNSGWGWNAGLLWRSEQWRLGVSYRSAIDIDHEGTLTIKQISTGSATLDAIVRSQLPSGPLDENVAIDLPSSFNFGVSYRMSEKTTIAFEADRTDWSSFDQLVIKVPADPSRGTTRATKWKDTWAYRVGFETQCGPIVCRAGYYRDETPQPLADVGPVFPDADRQALTAGISFGPRNGRWAIDIADVYVPFDDRTTTASSDLAGTWKTTGNEFAVNFRWR